MELRVILYNLASIERLLLPEQRLCRCDKRGEPQEVGCAPLLRFSPFEIPFPYHPLVRSTWVGFVEFLLSVQRADDLCGEVIRTFAFCIRKICKAPDNTNS